MITPRAKAIIDAAFIVPETDKTTFETTLLEKITQAAEAEVKAKEKTVASGGAAAGAVVVPNLEALKKEIGNEIMAAVLDKDLGEARALKLARCNTDVLRDNWNRIKTAISSEVALDTKEALEPRAISILNAVPEVAMDIAIEQMQLQIVGPKFETRVEELAEPGWARSEEEAAALTERTQELVNGGVEAVQARRRARKERAIILIKQESPIVLHPALEAAIVRALVNQPKEELLGDEKELLERSPRLAAAALSAAKAAPTGHGVFALLNTDSIINTAVNEIKAAKAISPEYAGLLKIQQRDSLEKIGRLLGSFFHMASLGPAAFPFLLDNPSIQSVIDQYVDYLLETGKKLGTKTALEGVPTLIVERVAEKIKAEHEFLLESPELQPVLVKQILATTTPLLGERHIGLLETSETLRTALAAELNLTPPPSAAVLAYFRARLEKKEAKEAKEISERAVEILERGRAGALDFESPELIAAVARMVRADNVNNLDLFESKDLNEALVRQILATKTPELDPRHVGLLAFSPSLRAALAAAALGAPTPGAPTPSPAVSAYFTRERERAEKKILEEAEGILKTGNDEHALRGRSPVLITTVARMISAEKVVNAGLYKSPELQKALVDQMLATSGPKLDERLEALLDASNDLKIAAAIAASKNPPATAILAHAKLREWLLAGMVEVGKTVLHVPEISLLNANDALVIEAAAEALKHPPAVALLKHPKVRRVLIEGMLAVKGADLSPGQAALLAHKDNRELLADAADAARKNPSATALQNNVTVKAVSAEGEWALIAKLATLADEKGVLELVQHPSAGTALLDKILEGKVNQELQVAIAGHPNASARALRDLMLLNDKEINAQILQRQAADVATLALHFSANKAVVAFIMAHARHKNDPLVVAAVELADVTGGDPGRRLRIAQDHDATTEKQLEALTIACIDLRANELAVELVQCKNISAKDLAKIVLHYPDAARPGQAAILAHVKAHTRANDPEVAAALKLAPQLVEAGIHDTSAARLHALVAVNNARLDRAIVGNDRTAAEDLVQLAIRHETNVEMVEAIARHATYGGNPLVIAVVGVVKASRADRLAMVASASKEQLHALTLLDDPELDAKIVLCNKVSAEDLARLAIRQEARTTFLQLIKAHALYTGKDPLLVAAVAVAEADPKARLKMAADHHDDATEETLQALTLLSTLSKNRELALEIVRCQETRALDIAEIVFCHPDDEEILEEIRDYTSQNKESVLIAALARADDLAEARNPATSEDRLHALVAVENALVDQNLVDNPKTEAEDLAMLAIRHRDNADMLTAIEDHPYAGEPLVAMALEVARLGDDDALAMVEGHRDTATAVQLQVLTLLENEDIDAEIVQCDNVRVEDLLTILMRHVEDRGIVESIRTHRIHGASPSVVKALTRVHDILEAGDDDTDPEKLHELAGMEDLLIDAALLKNESTSAETVALLAIRYRGNEEILDSIIALPLCDESNKATFSQLVFDAVAIAGWTDDERMARAQNHDKATMEELHALALMDQPKLDAEIVRCKYASAGDLGTIAIRHAGDKTIIDHITHHATHGKTPSVVAALERADRLVEARNPATLTAQLQKLTAFDFDDELLDEALAQHPNMSALGLAKIAIRREKNPKIVEYVENHVVHGRTALIPDPLVAAAVAVAKADPARRLRMAQGYHVTTALQLQALTLLGKPDLDAEIVQCDNVSAEDLATIAIRRAGHPGIRASITGHPTHGTTPSVVAALARAGRLVEARDLKTDADRVKDLTADNDPLMDEDLAQHPEMTAVNLAKIAIRRAKNPKIVGYVENHVTLGAGAGNDRLVAAAVEVARANPAARLKIAEAPGATAEQLQALTMANGGKALDLEIAKRENVRPEDLASLAVGWAAIPEIIAAIRAHKLVLTAKNPKVLAALLQADRLREAKSAETEPVRFRELADSNDVSIDEALVRNWKTTAEVLAILAIRHRANATILGHIKAHALYADAFGKSPLVIAAVAVAEALDDAARLAMADVHHRDASAEILQALTLLDRRDVDTEIVQCEKVSAEDLATIAIRCAGDKTIIDHIQAHPLTLALDRKVLAALSRAEGIREAKDATTSPARLAVLADDNDPLIDAALVEHDKTTAETLAILAVRHRANTTLLARIKAHGLYTTNDPLVLAAVQVAEVDRTARLALVHGHHADASAQTLQALTLLGVKDPELDAEIAQCEHARAEDLAEIAIRHAGDKVIIDYIRVHAHKAAKVVVEALALVPLLVEARNPATLDARLSLLTAMPRLTSVNRLHLDRDIARHPKTRAEDLAALAIRHIDDKTIVSDVEHNATLGVAPGSANALVAAAVQVARMTGVEHTAASKGVDSSKEVLHALTLLDEKALDEHIVQRQYASAEDLIAIAIRHPGQKVITDQIAAHPRYLDKLVIEALTLAPLLVEARELATDADRLHKLTAVENAHSVHLDREIARHPQAAAGTLALLAIRHAADEILWDVEHNLTLGVDGTADPLVLAAVAVAKVDSKARLAMLQGHHATATAATLQALTLLKDEKLDAEIVECANARPEDLVEIAIRRAGKNDAIIKRIAAHVLHGNKLVEEALELVPLLAEARKPLTPTARLSVLTATPNLTPVNKRHLDRDIAQHAKTTAEGLAELAIRHEADDATIVKYVENNVTLGVPGAGNSLVAAAVRVARMTAGDRTTAAGENGSSEEVLHALMLLNDLNLDREIVQRPNISAEDLATIAVRRAHEPLIKADIRIHATHQAAKVVIDAVAKADRLVEAREPKTGADRLEELTAYNDPLMEEDLARHVNTKPINLAEIAIRNEQNLTIVGYVENNATHGVAAGNHPVVAAAVAVAKANPTVRLTMAQAPAATADQLQALTLAKGGLALDLAIAKNPRTRREDLDAILTRTNDPNALIAIAGHVNTDVAMTLKIVSKAGITNPVVKAVEAGAHRADPGVVGAIGALSPAVRMVFSSLGADVAAGRMTPGAAAAGLSAPDKANLTVLTMKERFKKR